MDQEGFYIDRTLSSLKRLVLLYGNTLGDSAFLMQKYVEALCSSIDSLRELVLDFNDIHEMYLQKAKLHFTTFDLIEVLQTVVDILSKEAHPEEIIITLPKNELAMDVTADRIRFQKAVYYFLSGILIPPNKESSASVCINKDTQLLRIIVTTPVQPEDMPVGSVRYTENLLRFYTAMELIKYQGGYMLAQVLSPYSNKYTSLDI